MSNQASSSFSAWEALRRFFFPVRFPQADEIFNRHNLIDGWKQQEMSRLKLLCVGSGALGGWLSRAAVRIGLQRLDLMDYDRVEASNLPRQPFDLHDLGRSKARQLAYHLREERTNPATIITPIPYSLEQAVGRGVPLDYSLVYVGVDNDLTRAYAARLFHGLGIPVIFAGTGRNSQKGYVFIQRSRPGSPCLFCLNPSIEHSEIKAGCQGAAADVPVVLAGLAIYALEGVVMGRPIHWDYWELSLPTGKSHALRVAAKQNCPLCQARS